MDGRCPRRRCTRLRSLAVWQCRDQSRDEAKEEARRRWLSGKKTEAAKTQRKEKRIDKEGGTTKGGGGEQETDGRAFQSLLGSLFGFAFPFLSRTKATLFRPYVHMDAS